MSSTCAEQNQPTIRLAGDTNFYLPELIEIHQAIGGNGLFCIPQSDPTQLNRATTTNELFVYRISKDKPTELQDSERETEARRCVNFLPKDDLFYPLILNKHKYRNFRFQQYRRKKYRPNSSPKVRYIERQKLAQRRFRLQGKFVSKQVQKEMASVHSCLELEQHIDESSFDKSTSWPNNNLLQPEETDIFYYCCREPSYFDTDMFQESLWSISEDVTLEYLEAENFIVH